MTDNYLEKCPCCGPEVEEGKEAAECKGTYWIQPYYVECPACGLRTKGYDTPAAAREAWNRRFRRGPGRPKKKS